MRSAAVASVPTQRRLPFVHSRAGSKSEGLAEALAEGISTGHPDMPEFVFEADEVGAIIQYLESIQQR